MAAGASIDPARARGDVRAILRGARFHPRTSPRPLDGVLSWLDRVLAPVGRFFKRVFLPVGHAFAWVWLHTIGLLPAALAIAVSAALIVAVLAVLGRTIARRAAPAPTSGSASFGRRLSEADVVDLMRLADDAESRGEYDIAVRLRFRAGLHALERDAGAIVNRPALTTTEVRRTLQSPRFDGLADTFESVAYGGAVAVADDAADAREEWPVVVADARKARR
jgi:hypothetical protein